MRNNLKKIFSALLATLVLLSIGTINVYAEELSSEATPSSGTLMIEPHLAQLNLTDTLSTTLHAYLDEDNDGTPDIPVVAEWSITMQASIDGKMSGVIKFNSTQTTSETMGITALTAGTATVEIKYGGLENKSMVMVETTGLPTPPAPDIPDSTGKLILNPHLTILNMLTKPTSEVSAYYNNEPVECTWEISMHASVNGKESETIYLKTASPKAISATITALTPGTATIKATYGKESTMAMVMIENVAPEEIVPTSISIVPETTTLSTIGTKTTTLTAVVNPEGVTQAVTWKTSTPSVATVEATGDRTATVTAVSEGEAIITATVGELSTTVDLVVNNNSIIAGSCTVSASTPDTYTISVIPVANPAINADAVITDVSIFTWSESSMKDLDCKEAVKNGDVWSYTFPVNDTDVHSYYQNADDIQINIYASADNASPELIVASNYSWVDNISGGTVAYIAYSQNIGFDRPTILSGAAGLPASGVHMEGLRISSLLEGVEISSSVHAAGLGWLPTVSDGAYSGTMWEDRQIESIILTLSGPNASQHSIQYRVYQEGTGWTDWVGNGQEAGITGQGLQIEAFQVQLF